MSKTSPKGVLSGLKLQNEHREGFVCFAGCVGLYPGSQIVEKCNPLSEKMPQGCSSVCMNHEYQGRHRGKE